MSEIHVIKGRYRDYKVNDCTFPIVKPIKEGAKGEFVTVDASDVLGEGFEKIRITLEEYEIIGDYSEVVKSTNKTETKKEETDEELTKRMVERFEILDEMTRAICSVDAIRALIVTGPPGVGKSYGVEAILDEFSLLDDLSSRRRRYEVVKGAMTPVGLYRKLYRYSNEGDVLVFDDCDDVFDNELTLNLLKAALDTGKRRIIQWNAASKLLENEGIPNRFEFDGSVIFISNLDLSKARGKLRAHTNALVSRCHFLNLDMFSEREQILRVKYVANEGGLFRKNGIDYETECEILDFMEKNSKRLNEVSVRMAVKLAGLAKMSKERWKTIAEQTCMGLK